MFFNLQSGIANQVKPIVADDDVQSLSLPNICDHHNNRRIDIFSLQTYRDFASKAERRNPEVTFDRSKMDRAFDFTAKRLLTKAKGTIRPLQGEFNRMMSRVRLSFALRYPVVHRTDR